MIENSIIKKALSTLTEREQGVIHHRFVSYETLEQVGRRYQVTRERIRQIEARALWKLRDPYPSLSGYPDDSALTEFASHTRNWCIHLAELTTSELRLLEAVYSTRRYDRLVSDLCTEIVRRGEVTEA